MGKSETGVFSDWSGGIDNLVGAVVHGEQQIRKKPAKSSKPPVQSQIDQRIKFAIVAAFVKSLAPVIQIGYQSFNKNSPRNAAVSYHLKNAITGVSPDFAFDYTAAVLSKGGLPKGMEMELTELPDRGLKLSWTQANSLTQNDKLVRGTDLVYAVFYSVEEKMYLVIEGSATRASLEANTIIPRMFKGNTLHSYVFFVSADGKLVSDSQYLGSMLVPTV